MARKRDGLAPVEEAMSDLDGPVKKLRDAPGGSPLHPLRSGEPVDRGRRSGPRHGLHGAAAGAVLTAPHQPRQPAAVQEGQRALHAGYERRDQQQAPLRQLPAPARLHPPSRRWAGGGSTHGKMREVICSRSLRGSIQFSRRQGGEYGIGFEIKRQADDGLRGGEFDRAGKAGGTIGSRGARGKYRRQFLCADRFRSQPALLQSLKLCGGDLHHQAAILVLGFDRLPTRGNESAGRRIVEEDTDDRLLAGELRP